MTIHPHTIDGLLLCALGANLGMGAHQFMLTLETIRDRQIEFCSALFVGVIYAAPPTLIVLALARMYGII